MKWMKKFRKPALLLAAAATLLLAPGTGTLTASAAEGTTYYVFYSENDNGWRFFEGNEYVETPTEREIYYLENEVLKDGDLVVVDCANAPGNEGGAINLPKHLSNLTVKTTDASKDNAAVIHTKGIDYCYILGGAVAAVNGDVATAEVYDDARVTFNNNVSSLRVFSSGDDIDANISVGGTVGHLYRKHQVELTDYYDFAAGKFQMVNGSLNQIAEEYYSSTPSAQTYGSPASGTTPKKEYDDVPKTGDNSWYLWLFAASGLCFAAGRLVKRS